MILMKNWFWNFKMWSNLHIPKTKYRDSPVSAVFWSPANRTFGKTALIGDCFSTKTSILDFWIFKVHFLGIFWYT